MKKKDSNKKLNSRVMSTVIFKQTSVLPKGILNTENRYIRKKMK